MPYKRRLDRKRKTDLAGFIRRDIEQETRVKLRLGCIERHANHMISSGTMTVEEFYRMIRDPRSFLERE